MRLMYWEQKEKRQIEMERICIRFVENELLPELPKYIWSQNVEVKFSPTKFKGYQDIEFRGEDFLLRVRAIYRGKFDTVIEHEIWYKEMR